MGSFGHYEQNYSHILSADKCGEWMNEQRELLTLLESLLNANLVRTASLLYIVKIITLVGASFISKFGDERYIALRNQNGNNYDGTDGTENFTVPSSKSEQEQASVGINNTEEAIGTNTDNTETA